MMSQKFKSHFSFAAVAMLGGLVLMTGCEKENQDASNIPEGSLRISTEGVHSNAKTTVEGVTVLWEDGDRVNFNGDEAFVVVNGSRAYLSNVENSDSMYAVFPYDIFSSRDRSTITLNMPSAYEYREVNEKQKVDLPMVACAAGGSYDIEFKHVTSTLKVVVRNVSTSIPNPAAFYLDTISVKSSAYAICGQVTVDAKTMSIGSRPELSVGNNDEVTMTFAPNAFSVPVDETKEIQVPVLFNEGNSDITVHIVGHYASSVDLGTGCIDAAAEVNYTNTANNATLPRAYVIPATCSIHPRNAAVTLNYPKFQVDVNRWVYFSHGNLQYNLSSTSWRMAATQRDFIGVLPNPSNNIDDGNNSIDDPTYGGWIDLFGWGTKTNPTNTSLNDDDYTWAEWGENGLENATGSWRTITKPEMVYLCNTRSTGATVNGTSDARYTLGKVYNVIGVILFPDGFEEPTLSASSSWGVINDVTGGTIIYDLTDWKLLESAGCVFLPAGGIREGASTNSSGSTGNYWTKDNVESDKAYYLNFKLNGLSASSRDKKHKGMSVRLVQTAN